MDGHVLAAISKLLSSKGAVSHVSFVAVEDMSPVGIVGMQRTSTKIFGQPRPFGEEARTCHVRDCCL